MKLGDDMRQPHGKLLSQDGASLIELLVGLAMSGILVMANITIVQMMGSAAKNVTTRDNKIALTQMITNQISFGDSCLAAFNNVTVNLGQAVTPLGQEIALTIPNIGAGATGNSNVISASANLNDTAGLVASLRLRVMSLNINSLSAPIVTLVPPQVPVGEVHDIRRAILTMRVSRYGSAVAGGNELSSAVVGAVMLTLDQATNRVVACYGSTQRSLRDTCVAMGGQYDDTRNPPCRFMAEAMECDSPGTALIAIRGGVPYCVQLGGDCAANELVKGVGINRVICETPTAVTSTVITQ
jgi:hypothetical protein